MNMHVQHARARTYAHTHKMQKALTGQGQAVEIQGKCQNFNGFALFHVPGVVVTRSDVTLGLITVAVATALRMTRHQRTRLFVRIGVKTS